MIVYCAYNTVTEKCYVGKTKHSVDSRIRNHVKVNKSPFQLALNKYGLKSFRFGIIDIAKTAISLNHKERAWIKRLNCKSPHGYNLTSGGDGLTDPTPETREACGNGSRGRVQSLEERAKRTAVHAKRPDVIRARRRRKRRQLPENVERRWRIKCQRISKRLKRHYEDPANRQRVREQNKDQKPTDEQRAQNAAALKKLWQIPKWRANQVIKRVGKKDTEDTKNKKGASAKLAWQKPERRRRGAEVMLNNHNTLGWVWINNGTQNRMIPENGLLPEGWVIGMLSTHMIGRCVITDGQCERRIYPDEALPDGWRYGRSESARRRKKRGDPK